MGSSYVGRKKEETMGSSSQVERKKTYELNERVLCQHTDNLYYDAKIVGMSVARSGTRLYTIHYKGWSKRYDETFEESKAAFRLRPFTESGFIKARAELKAARAKIQLARKAKLSGTRKGFIKKERESEKRQNLVTSSAPGNTARARSESARTARAITTKAKTLKKNACLSVPAALSDKSREGKLKKVEVKMDEDELMAGSVGPAERRSNRSHIASSKRELTKDKRDAVVTSNEHASTKSAAAKRRAEDSLEAMSDVNKLAWGFHQRERSAIKRVAAQYESDAERPFFNVNSKELPPKMKELLKKDMEMSLAGKTLPKLPARSSISKILNEFAKYMQRLNDVCGIPNRRVSVTWKATAASLNECVDGLKDLFDVIVAHQLLTEKELCRHEELLQWGIIRRRRDILGAIPGSHLRPCEVYGYIHLLRLLVNFGPIPQSIGTVDGVVLEALKGFSNCLNLYLVNHAEELFDIAEDYAPIVAQ